MNQKTEVYYSAKIQSELGIPLEATMLSNDLDNDLQWGIVIIGLLTGIPRDDLVVQWI